jgi:hypothetical protein
MARPIAALANAAHARTKKRRERPDMMRRLRRH